jgi:acetyl esterase
MTSSPLGPEPPPGLDAGAGLAVHRVAEVQMRARGGPLRARLYWPVPPGPGAAPGLLVFFQADGFTPGGAGSAATLCRGLCAHAGVAVLSAPYRPAPDHSYPAAFRDATTSTAWAADHATELDADPGRLLVAGQGCGGNLAAAVALYARDHGWPPIRGQVLIHPNLRAVPSPHPYASPLRAPSLAGVAPATVVTAQHDPLRDDGPRYAARLREAGVDVEELRCDDLAPALRRILSTPTPDDLP